MQYPKQLERVLDYAFFLVWAAVIFVILAMLTSCSSTKQHTKKVDELQRKIDSMSFIQSTVLEVEKKVFLDRIVEKPVEVTTYIPIECDEEGNVKPVEYSVSSGKDRFSVISEDNKLAVTTYKDSVLQVFKKEYESRKEIDSIRISKKAIDFYKKTQTELKVKEPFFLFAHLKCVGVVALLLLGFYGWSKFKK